MLVAQRTVDDFLHERFACLFGEPMAEPSVDKRYFQSLDTIMSDVGNKIHVVNVELSVSLSVGIYFSEKFNLVLVEILAHFLHRPDVTEELGAQVAVAHHRFLDHAQVSVDELHDLVLRPNLFRGHLVELVAQPFELRLDDSVIDILFSVEIGIKRAAAFARGHGNVIHRRAGKSVLGEELSRHIH